MSSAYHCLTKLSNKLLVKLLVHLAELLVGEVGVDLCGGDGGVAKHVLDGAEVGAVE